MQPEITPKELPQSSKPRTPTAPRAEMQTPEKNEEIISEPSPSLPSSPLPPPSPPKIPESKPRKISFEEPEQSIIYSPNNSEKSFDNVEPEKIQTPPPSPPRKSIIKETNPSSPKVERDHHSKLDFVALNVLSFNCKKKKSFYYDFN